MRALLARPWSLQRRLVVIVVALVTGVCVALAAASTATLRASLVGRLDDALHAASQRAGRAPDLPPPDDAVQGPRPSEEPRSDDGTPPPFLTATGQSTGTLGLRIVRGDVSAQGFVDDDGEVQQLTPAQVAVLAGVPADGEPRTVDLPGLGAFRVVSATLGQLDDARGRDDDAERPGVPGDADAADDAPGGISPAPGDGDDTDDSDAGPTDRTAVQVTGLSMDGTTQTLAGYLTAEVGVALLAIALAALGATWLVHRALAPLTRVTQTATRIAELPLHAGEVALPERVDDVDPVTEVGRMGTAFNQMIDHVEAALSARYDSEMQVRQFVADASHELRTPLASIRGYAELVRRSDDDVPAATAHSLGRIEAESLRMSALVEDLLLLARLDAGRPLERTDVDLTTIAVECVADAHAAGADHVWRLDLPGYGDGSDDDGPSDDAVGDPTGGEGTAPLAGADGEPCVVRGDEPRLRQVLVNLLSNARVHTPPGTVVTVALRRDGADVVLDVHDDGPGIPPALTPHLFDRFTRGDSARSRAGGSTGLGLAIVQAVVAAHDGTIAVETDPAGTTFRVTLPAA